MHHLTCGVSSLLHSVNLIVFTLLLVHLILRISPHHSHHLRSRSPRYLAADLRRLSDMPSRRHLRSSLTDQLDVRQSQCSTVGDRAFAVAGARLWNSLPHDIVASDTLSHFHCRLKTFLFRQSYPFILF